MRFFFGCSDGRHARSAFLTHGCLGLVLAVAGSGCQGVGGSALLSGFSESKQEREIVRLAEHDPFPSPSDVGFSTAE